MEKQSCMCDSTNLKNEGKKDGYTYYRCKDCGNLFGVPDQQEE